MNVKESIPNTFLNRHIPKFQNSNPKIQRVLSMLLDHIIMCIVIAPIVILTIGLLLHFEESLNKVFIIILIFLPYLVYFNKDFFNAKSPAKRILGYQIIDRKNNELASELQCFVRNLTIIAWPIEVIIGLINPERRIGDFLANTKVVVSEKEKLKSIWVDLKKTTLKINYLGIIIIGGIYFYGLGYLFFDFY